MTGYAAAETALVMFVLAVVATLTRRTPQPFTRMQGGGFRHRAGRGQGQSHGTSQRKSVGQD